jgi:predicted transcriptional regulator YdeE
MGSKLVKFEVKPFTKARVIGKSVIVKLDAGINDASIQDLWEKMADDGSLDFLFDLPDRITKDPDTVGWMGDFQPGDKEYTYLAGVLVKHNTPVPDGYAHRDIEDCEMAIGWVQETEGEEGGDIHAQASDHIQKAMKENGYEYDGSKGFFEMEYCSYERFHGPEKRGDKVVLDFYSPCKKA